MEFTFYKFWLGFCNCHKNDLLYMNFSNNFAHNLENDLLYFQLSLHFNETFIVISAFFFQSGSLELCPLFLQESSIIDFWKYPKYVTFKHLSVWLQFLWVANMNSFLNATEIYLARLLYTSSDVKICSSLASPVTWKKITYIKLKKKQKIKTFYKEVCNKVKLS